MCRYSIVIPVYNCEKFLGECINSVLNQSCKDFEMILVDDGSTDSSGALCDSFAEKYKKIKAYHTKNGGASSARNFGLKRASGEYILFVDGDDTLERLSLEQLQHVIECYGPDMIVYGMSFDYYQNGSMVKNEKLSCAFRGVKSKNEVLHDVRAYFANNTLSSACNKVFKKSIIQNHGIQFQNSMTLYEDFHFNLNYMLFSENCYFLDEALYHYRHETENRHIDLRVKNLAKLQENLDILMNSMLALKAQNRDCRITDIGANLYMQLLNLRLITARVSKNELKTEVKSFCRSDYLKKALLNGAELGQREERLYRKICSNQFVRIQAEFMIKRMKSVCKSKMKQWINKY